MILYNYKKEFLGIEEKDLQALGFKSLQGLQKEVSDFADLFVKTPGYIHNFKHVHWIDFITCAESNEESKVIINVNNKNYRATIQITTTYLIDSPASKAFMVHLTHLNELTAKESENISGDIIERQAPIATTKPTIFPTNITHETQEELSEIQEEDLPLSLDTFDTPDKAANVTVDPYEVPLDVAFEDEFIDEKPLDVTFEDDFSLNVTTEEDTETEPPITPTTQIIQENFENGYIYDPTVASDELGLPLDLIEEFIQDFIGQAKEFKEELYTSHDNGDLDNLKILSHKLKGVAANLRIEDALETITEVNSSSDFTIIKKNLDTFYNIIAKLAGENISVVEEIEEIEEAKEDDLYSNPLEIKDIDVPEKIEIAELADDTFEEEITLDIKDDEFKLEEVDFEKPKTEEFIYNKDIVANDIGLDIESFNELFEDYRNETESLITTLQNAIESEDFTTCKSEAIKLKGMSNNMRISSFNQELQILINSSNKQELIDALDRVKLALRTL